MSSQLNSNLMPVLALRGLVVFPGMLLHFDVGRPKSINAINIAMENNQTLLLVTQKDLKNEDPKRDDLYDMGCVVSITQIMHAPDNTLRVSIVGKYRASYENLKTVNNCFIANVTELDETYKPKNKNYVEALLRKTRYNFEHYAALTNKMPNDIKVTIVSNEDPGYLSDYIASNLQLSIEDRITLQREVNQVNRLKLACEILHKEWQILTIDEKINERAKIYLDDAQKEYYLREQMHAISTELYGDDGPEAEAEEYRFKIAESLAPEYAKKVMLSETDKLFKMPAGSHEATVVRNYLDLLLELPWGKTTKLSSNLEKAEKLLNKEHYGLNDVKDKILEHLAVFKLNPNIKGQIICLVGPPGDGKTSAAKSLAKCMNRNFARVSLGGVHDEAEILGHRRTYIGALPGRIIKAVKSADSNNPLILLDEVDKMSSDLKGDPASALLEVLDSEQNNAFYDHYVDIPYDLSGVLFVCTANNISNIPAPLLDRMDVIEIPGYTRIDKFHIAKEHLIKKQMELNGLNGKVFKITDTAIYKIIDNYTKEAGVRKLERKLSEVMRKTAREYLKDNSPKTVKPQDVSRLLGAEKYIFDDIPEKDEIGIVNGLAWTEAGGEIMQIEASVLKGTGKIELTGSLGDVMKESAVAAVSYVRANAENFGIDPDFYKDTDIHIHATEAAVPKDGPSAGVSITTAIVSALTNTPIKRDVAMTGEVSILGRVFPIGGLKEKTMAALRAGIKTVIIPSKNEKDYAELYPEVKENINFVFADDVNEVLDAALCKKSKSINIFTSEKAQNTLRI